MHVNYVSKVLKKSREETVSRRKKWSAIYKTKEYTLLFKIFPLLSLNHRTKQQDKELHLLSAYCVPRHGTKNFICVYVFKPLSPIKQASSFL